MKTPLVVAYFKQEKCRVNFRVSLWWFMQSDLTSVLSPSDINLQILAICTLSAYCYVARYEICVKNDQGYVPLVENTKHRWQVLGSRPS